MHQEKALNERQGGDFIFGQNSNIQRDQDGPKLRQRASFESEVYSAIFERTAWGPVLCCSLSRERQP